MYICHLIVLFLRALQMFLLPDVVSSAIPDVVLMSLVLGVTSVSTELTEILNMILSDKGYLACC